MLVKIASLPLGEVWARFGSQTRGHRHADSLARLQELDQTLRSHASVRNMLYIIALRVDCVRYAVRTVIEQYAVSESR